MAGGEGDVQKERLEAGRVCVTGRLDKMQSGVRAKVKETLQGYVSFIVESFRLDQTCCEVSIFMIVRRSSAETLPICFLMCILVTSAILQPTSTHGHAASLLYHYIH